MASSLFTEGKKYTFSDYFDFNLPTEEIADAFGYFFDTKILEFPTSEEFAKNEIVALQIKELQKKFYEVLPKISLNSEMAKRDFMIAPVLWAVIRHVRARINVQYPIEVDDRLGGLLDYLIKSDQQLIVIEAKKGDLDKGFNQLTAELIALDKAEEKDSPALLYGAVSIGELWRFGILNRNGRNIYRDLHTYRVPEDIQRIFSIMVGILQDGSHL
ncbi:MAG: hypothetical protein BECKG1743D_GA0114223_1000713 [Candidatus Kentron sp. G]|nr:MAG: hypothetical protein BECKG1743F_GA0114225_1000614 [Candidatus Kentron sp. G]VFM95586.1 MAG: hypothetical protein BECKG1743E_GA0114224_1000714 [Candidatus Kentron sp. G]VFM97280.1 MAG: hypothetical protein BECKG1743D_GA0114223_1000713 [Candidatus Kentron sp. G]